MTLLPHDRSRLSILHFLRPRPGVDDGEVEEGQDETSDVEYGVDTVRQTYIYNPFFFFNP